jgi:hypothetical protein
MVGQKVVPCVLVLALEGPSTKGEGTRWARKGRVFGLHRSGRLPVVASMRHKSSMACSGLAAVWSPG